LSPTPERALERATAQVARERPRPARCTQWVQRSRFAATTRCRVTLLASLVCTALAASAGAASETPDSGGTKAQFGGVIVFWDDSPWPSIWAMRAGSRPRRILRNDQNAKRPRLSPDRGWVAFDGARPGKPPISDFDIQLVQLDGTGLRTLTDTAEWDVDAQWSPDGTSRTFTRMPPRDGWLESWVWAVGADGTGLRRIVRGRNARWSPDGTRLVFAAPTAKSKGDLFVVGADGGRRRLVLASREVDEPAGWSPNGRRILFTRFTDSSGRRADVYTVNVDGTRLRRLGPGIAGSWSPDGTKVLYADSYLGRLWIMRADGSGKRRLLYGFGAEPDWR
jgi:Tol biopolymer transport system component